MGFDRLNHDDIIFYSISIVLAVIQEIAMALSMWTCYNKEPLKDENYAYIIQAFVHLKHRIFLNQVRRLTHAWFLEIDLAHEVCMCARPPRLVITNGMIWTPYGWLNKFYSFCMAAIVSIISRHSLTIEVRHRKHPIKSKLALYKLLLHYYNHLKQLYISKKMQHFSYKGGCGIHRHMHIETFKTRAGLGYR